MSLIVFTPVQRQKAFAETMDMGMFICYAASERN